MYLTEESAQGELDEIIQLVGQEQLDLFAEARAVQARTRLNVRFKKIVNLRT